MTGITPIPPIVYVGAYALFALIFALFGALFAKKYRWQYAITKIAVVALSAMLAVLILNAAMSSFASTLADALRQTVSEPKVEELFGMGNTSVWISGIVGMIASLMLFVPLFAILKAILNLISKLICNAVFKAVTKQKLPEEKKEKIEKKEETAEEKNEENNESIKSNETNETNENNELSPALASEAPVEYENYFTATPSSENGDKSSSPETHKHSNIAVGVEKKQTKTIVAESTSAWSLLCGAVSGFMVLNVIIAPLVCFVADIGGIASTVLGNVDFGIGEVEVAQMVEPACDNLAVDIVSFCGGRAIYNSLASFKVGDETVVLGNELRFADGAAKLAFTIAKSRNMSESQMVALIDSTIEAFEQTALIPIVLSDVANGATNAWLEGKEFIGTPRPEVDGLPEETFDELLGMFANTTPETMREDIVTLCRAISAAVDNGAMRLINSEDDDKILAFLENEEGIAAIFEVLLDNKRLSPAVTMLANTGVGLLTDTMGIPENDESIYNGAVDKLTVGLNVASGEKSTEIIFNYADTVKEAYDYAGLALPAGAEYTVSAYIISKADRSLTNDDIKTILKNENGELDLYGRLYKSVNLKKAATDPVAEATAEFVKLGIPEDAAAAVAEKLVSKLTSSKAEDVDFSVSGIEALAERSVRITAEDIRIPKTELTDGKKEAETLAKVVSAVAKMSVELSDMKENIEINTLMEKVGSLLDTLSQSEYMKGDVIGNTVTGLLQSDFVRQTLGINSFRAASLSNNVSESVKKGDTYTKHLLAIGKTVNVITSKDSEQSKEELKELITTVTPATSETLKELVSEDVLMQNGIDEQKSEAISGMFGSMFDKMAEVNETNSDDAYVTKEAEAVSKAIDIATTDAEKFKDGVFGTEEEAEAKIKEYTDLVTDSDIMTDVIVEAVFGESDEPKLDPLGFGQSLPEHEKELVVDRLDTMYKEEKASSTNAEELKEYEKLVISMAAFLNLNVSISDAGVSLK